MKRKLNANESGVLILEATFGLFITMVVMMFLLSIGLLLYQRVLVTVVANQTANDIAQVYKLWDVSDNGSLTKEDVTDIKIFRGFRKDKFDAKNTKKAYAYISSRLKQTSLAPPDGMLDVTVETVHDDIGRNHYEITVTQKYVFLFGDILNMMGLRGYDEISTVSRVEAKDMTGYISTVKLYKYLAKKTENNSFVKIIALLWVFLKMWWIQPRIRRMMITKNTKKPEKRQKRRRKTRVDD